MPRMTRNELLAAVVTSNKIMSATWPRRVKKTVHLCPNCRLETASHNGEWTCRNCGVVRPDREQRAEQGELVTMQFRRPIPADGTKNFTPAGGYMFNAPTAEAAAEIRRRKGLLGVLKMSETDTDDLRALPRTIPIFDVISFTMEGETFHIAD